MPTLGAAQKALGLPRGPPQVGAEWTSVHPAPLTPGKHTQAPLKHVPHWHPLAPPPGQAEGGKGVGCGGGR